MVTQSPNTILSLVFMAAAASNIITSTEAHCSEFIALSSVSNQGNITSPRWPAPYPPQARCDYKLQGEEWQGVKITFHHFDLEPPYQAGCLSDYLEVATVNVHGRRTFRGRYCGSQIPGPLLFLQPVVELKFSSNHAIHRSGFSATYEFVDEAYVTSPRLNATSPCGHVVTGIGGVISSPGFPKGYASGLDCIWLIRVRYSHSIYLRIKKLQFQTSSANCDKAQLRIYDGYEHSIEKENVIKRFCGDTRFYKGDEEKMLLSDRNRILIRFTTTDTSKPVINDTGVDVGFQVVWSDVVFDMPENCSRNFRFACQEAQICFTKHHTGGTSSCPDLRHYCISKDLVCDGIQHCHSVDSSDEIHCNRSPTITTMVAIPLGILSFSLCVCFVWYKNCGSNSKRLPKRTLVSKETNSATGTQRIHDNSGSCCSSCCVPKDARSGAGSASSSDQKSSIKSKVVTSFGDQPSLEIPRGPIFFKSEQDSPGASDVVSPASGFSDSESELSQQVGNCMYCPAHGHFIVGPNNSARLFPRLFPMPPVLEEQVVYSCGAYDEGGSTYSNSQNSDTIYVDKACPPSEDGDGTDSLKLQMNDWKLKQWRRTNRPTDFMSDDGKSSVASSPGRVCPRCLEKDIGRSNTRLDKETSTGHVGVQFDSGIDMNHVGSGNFETKNISFETSTSSDSTVCPVIGAGCAHQSRINQWKQGILKNSCSSTDPVVQTFPCSCNEGADANLRVITTSSITDNGRLKASCVTCSNQSQSSQTDPAPKDNYSQTYDVQAFGSSYPMSTYCSGDCVKIHSTANSSTPNPTIRFKNTDV